MKVAPDVPQKLIDVFNKVDFPKVNSIMRMTLISQIKSWVVSNIPAKQAGKVYKSNGEKKIVAKGFDEELMGILNNADFSQVPQAKLNEVIEFLNKYIKLLPLKK